MIPKRQCKTYERNNESGSVLILTVVSMFALVLMVGLAIDIGHFYLVKTELQDAADAAALAAAKDLNGTKEGITGARNRAMEVMNKYEFNKTDVAIPSANILFSININSTTRELISPMSYSAAYSYEETASASAPPIRFVQVTTPPYAIPVYFAYTLGNTTNKSATATAGLSVNSNVLCNFMPLSAVKCDPGASGCSLNVELPCTPTDPTCPYTTQYCAGCRYVIKGQPGPGSTISPGNWQALEAGGTGADPYRDALAGGVKGCTSCLQAKTGSMRGPTAAGLNVRLGIYDPPLAPSFSTQFPPDENVKQNVNNATYEQGLTGPRTIDNFLAPTIGFPGVAHRRVLEIPMIEQSAYPNGSGSNACIPLTNPRWGKFLLVKEVPKTGPPGGCLPGECEGDITAEYVGPATAPAGGGYVQGGGASTSVVTIVLYK